jgi:hypothetical protein
VFLTRYYYDYTKVHENVIATSLQRSHHSGSAKHGMLSLAFLFRSNYDTSKVAAALRSKARYRHQLAIDTLQIELERIDLAPEIKLMGLSEVISYDVRVTICDKPAAS